MAVRRDGSYTLLTGNEVGVLLLDYIGRARTERGTMPQNPVAVKSIVSTTLADLVAANYGIEMVNVLTGFKYIGDQIARLESKGEVKRFVFDFEGKLRLPCRTLRPGQGRSGCRHAGR